jgi:acetyl/propionyl-CoA carboxylase alpha subunit/acetyl-CoA carboxylase carboxyltransferase component
VLVKKLLVANRGEIAIRILRAAADHGVDAVAVFSEDDAASLHVRLANEACALRGIGAAAYLDAAQLIRVARETGCDAVHPGYGFLSENATFASACEAAGITFVGPAPATLELFGDKGRARALALEHGVPVPEGTFGATTLVQAEAFLRALGIHGAVMLKAVAGGGGRGMRLVDDVAGLASAFDRASSEAASSFGNGALYVERVIPHARHIEVQIAGDGSGAVAHLFERECSLQRRNQKLVEIAPAPNLSAARRERLFAAATSLASAVAYRNLGTFEFLVDAAEHDDGPFAFIEANPRLQVEHTVTEQVTGIDLVRLQLQLASGATLDDLALTQRITRPHRFALQARVNMETMLPDGDVRPSGGTLATFDLPSGPGVRVDTFGYGGYVTNPSFDSLLAKVIVTSDSPHLADVVAKARRALRELRTEGVETNRDFLCALLARPEVAAGHFTTRFVEEHMPELVAELAPAVPMAEDDGEYLTVRAPLQGRIVSIDVRAGDTVRSGAQIAVIDAMKMEHVVVAASSGIVRRVGVVAGEIVFAHHALAVLTRVADGETDVVALAATDPSVIRPDLAEVLARHDVLLDETRPAAVARRRKTGQRTTRENIADLCDDGTFVEYGGLALPAQRRRRALDDLIATGQADGLVAGTGDINGALFDASRARCMIMAYDYTVLAGTQGAYNHRKMDRLLAIVERRRFPIVLFAEGGGGRPGDTDMLGVAHLDVMSFTSYARLSGLVPRVGIVSGRCFAGNAALLGASDVIIATENASIGMGGPAMIEGGGLGIFTPEEVGPLAIQVPNGVVDIAVTDEREAVRTAKRYLSYFQGPLATWSCTDQTPLRGAIPENRLRVYDVRAIVSTIADEDSVLELRPEFGRGMVTAFARIEGRPLGIIANNPMHLGGAIDADGSDKAARFIQLCDAFSIPLLFLCDTPGIMVGPDAEKTGLVRHTARLFVNAATAEVPFFTIVLRKGYGLGAQAMAGGSFHAGFFTISWPTGEFGAMGLEGAIRLGYRKELEAVADLAERKALFDRMVAAAYADGKAINTATYLELDDVIDPADSRRWIRNGLDLAELRYAEPRKKRRTVVDTW